MRERASAFALLGLLLTANPAVAQEVSAPSAAASAADRFDQRAQTLPSILAEGGAIEDAFSADFLAAIPVDQVRSLFASLRVQYGAPQQVQSVSPSGSAGSGTVAVAFERATITLAMAVDANGRIAGLRITDVAIMGDTIERLTTDLAALPGTVGWGLYRLDADGAPRRVHGTNGEAHLAIGSSFKLAILGALDAEIAAGRLKWDDVIAIDRQSVPSSAILSWPAGAPMTLHSLATLMISVSDNRATDILLHHVGRDRVERFVRNHGGLSGANMFPILSTLEATVLKNPALGEARSRWLGGDEAERRRVLAQFASGWTTANVDYGAFAAGPADIERIEWFGSADAMARLMGWFAVSASAEARAIMAVNPGIPAAGAASWAYIGYKGGSEPGVMAMHFLMRARSGQSYALAIAWNNPAGAVDEARLAALATRAVALAQRED